jgi:hypothetical protein
MADSKGLGNADGERAWAQGRFASILLALDAAPRHVNPAIALYMELQDRPMEVEVLITEAGRIERAIQEGEEEVRDIERKTNKLADAEAVPAPSVPIGF